MGQRINILHVGDLHIRQRDFFEKDIVVKAFLKDIEKIAETELKPDLVAFSGDLVFSGDIENDFTLAWDHFIEPLSKITGCSHDHFFFSPGNHDVQRSIVEKQESLVTGLDYNIIDQRRLNAECSPSAQVGQMVAHC